MYLSVPDIFIDSLKNEYFESNKVSCNNITSMAEE